MNELPCDPDVQIDPDDGWMMGGWMDGWMDEWIDG